VRAETRAKVLGEGRPKRDADELAHEAAKAVWNGWAQKILAERSSMEKLKCWAAAKDRFGSPEEGQNDETREWLARAATDFSRCRFLVLKAEEIEAAVREEDPSTSADGDIKDIGLGGFMANFSDFMFPGGAAFVSATFSGDAGFDSTRFSDRARFSEATFLQKAHFVNASFSDVTKFSDALFANDTNFHHVRFERFGDFERALFFGRAEFFAIRAASGFSMAGARFEGVPDFIQAHFEEAHPKPARTISHCVRWLSRQRSG
jgi:hypothetical protein